jgi:hypothetical protein
VTIHLNARKGVGAKNPARLVGSSAVLGPFVRRWVAGVAKEARTRGFAAPAFAGCAFSEGVDTVGCGVSTVKWADQRLRTNSNLLTHSQLRAAS